MAHNYLTINVKYTLLEYVVCYLSFHTVARGLLNFYVQGR